MNLCCETAIEYAISLNVFNPQGEKSYINIYINILYTVYISKVTIDKS